MKLLSIGANAKTIKSDVSNKGYITAILYLEPNLKICPGSAKAKCMEGCLKSSGRMDMSGSRKARSNRTDLLNISREAFEFLLRAEIEKFSASAKKAGLKPAIRLNGTSDLVWNHIIEDYPEIQFYDYTKRLYRMDENLPGNYHLTYSYSGASSIYAEQALKALEKGKNLAVVFRDKIPNTWKGYRVIDGDKDDLRFLDEKNVVVGLTAKGKAKKDVSGFVQDV